MSNKFRKVLAAILAGTMVLGSGVVANAAEGSGEGSGSLDVVEASDVFNVILPTDSGDQFDYILDPTGIIAETDAAKYASASFVDGQTMYFRNKPASGSDIATYSNVSDPIKAYNKSTMDVEIQVKANLATPSGIIISTSSVAGQTTGTATPSIFLAVTEDGNTAKAAITETDRVVATSSITNAKANYKVVYASDSKTYKTSLATGSNAKTDDELEAAGFDCYSFSLMGDCNPNGKWIGLTEEPPKVSLVWTINKPDGALEVGTSPLTVSSTGLITHTGLTADKNYASMKITNKNGTFDIGEAPVTWNLDNHSAETGGSYTCQLGDFWMETLRGFSGGKVVVTLTDGSTVEANINIPAA